MNRFIASLFAAFVSFAAFTAAAEEVQSQSLAFQVRYSDGTVERYVARWTGNAELTYRESGHPAIPFKGWFTDTRRCHWTTTGQINRQVWLVNKHGQQFAAAEFYRAYTAAHENQGSSFVLNGLAPENCGQARARRGSDYNNMKTKVRQAFESVVDVDIERLRDELAGSTGVVDVFLAGT